MPDAPQDDFQRDVAPLDLRNADCVPQLVDVILAAAGRGGASDVHLVPRESELEMSWRIDGVLTPIASFPGALKANIVSRLKVLAELLTYHTDVPQEGRIRGGSNRLEMRVSTFPTLFGEKAVVRMFAEAGVFRELSSLGFPGDVEAALGRQIHETAGVVLVTGPAGSGKTTTVYACLREIAASSPVRKSIATLEDPIESVVAGIAQSQIRPARGFDYSIALKSLLRQDPEVIFVGEIRDVATAELVFQAGLTGHLVLTTFHAGSAADAVARLIDMEIEPFQLRSGLLCVLNQRLVRRLCDCAAPGTDPERRLGLEVNTFREPAGCSACGETGYRGRSPLVELLTLKSPPIASAVLQREGSDEIEACAVEAGMRSRWQQAVDAVEDGTTSPEEIRRVLGFGRRGG